MTMQVQIRHMGGDDVSLDDCARLSGPMSEALEASELLHESYVLEISSPGIGENLISDRDFITFRGFPIEVVQHIESNSTEIVKSGLLLERSANHVHLNIKGRIERIPRKEVVTVRLTTTTA